MAGPSMPSKIFPGGVRVSVGQGTDSPELHCSISSDANAPAQGLESVRRKTIDTSRQKPAGSSNHARAHFSSLAVWGAEKQVVHCNAPDGRMAVTGTRPPGALKVTALPGALLISAKLPGSRECPCPRSALHVCPGFSYRVGSQGD